MKAFDRFRGFKKGARSIKMTLENEIGIVYNLKRIRRLMNNFNIVCPHRKPNPYKRMAKATQEHRTVPNHLQRDFRKEIPVSPCSRTSPICPMDLPKWPICLPCWMLPQAKSWLIISRTELRWI
ncbi:IS3 family transposase [Paenibacillus illinoisensis]|uniref:IS3 family transposase n=1 Tax=Paenibacillus illinoisensis TaxID=59845 RepID=A0ABW8HRS9_9BACL